MVNVHTSAGSVRHRPTFDNIAYHIGGQVTPDAVVNGISGYYMGPAYGTYFSGSPGILMAGTFTCEVDGLSGTVPYFDLYVQDGGGDYSASIYGSGVFNGASGEFKIDSGTFLLNGASAANASATGSLYGPNGEHIGGAWAMDKGSANNAAVGIFVGDKEVGLLR